MKKIISGKVREVYETGESQLAIVATDRISAFDVILDSVIKDKGVALTQISNFWFDYTRAIVPNHILSANPAGLPQPCQKRTVLVKKLNMLPYEFIVRGYMFGSLWKEYQAAGSYNGNKYQLAEKLSEPVLTPAAKNSAGHDENISMEKLRQDLGPDETEKIYKISFALYETCAAHALQKGIILVDAKFEFGYDGDGTLTLGDEICTPDSSRFWAAEDYRTGISPKCFDKQFVRDWLTDNGLDGVEPGPALPKDIVHTTEGLYRECFRRLTGKNEY
ncbi:phosphoribosylaminoimidazolesuccinocarboxamide synthase [Acutalibacter sp. JLR.KK004]|jgi:phosphoribosylaminoimidazole-succinocarboxamide synthase|uniref:phosphoribosylaminoimidazolesuccinocarboxamide synthase n=1 Tax=Acutalibacter sp. JLR.KK004 TaxID=3112622 RepID=UPI002FEE76D1